MADVVRIGILGEEDAYDAKDTTARTTANSALEKANQALGLFPVTISNGGTGGNTLGTARTSLEVEYDAQIVMGIYAGRNLATVFATEIANYTDEAEWFNTRVVAGDFTGIRIFDYFDITLTDGRPVWGGNCTHCMACISRCPKHAIEYGKGTERRRRYVCPER